MSVRWNDIVGGVSEVIALAVLVFLKDQRGVVLKGQKALLALQEERRHYTKNAYKKD